MLKFKISARELRAKKERNFEERLKFIDLWVSYIKNTPDKIWSAQQKELIDAQMRGDSSAFSAIRQLIRAGNLSKKRLQTVSFIQ